jgi:hypothetical protein
MDKSCATDGGRRGGAPGGGTRGALAERPGRAAGDRTHDGMTTAYGAGTVPPLEMLRVVVSWQDAAMSSWARFVLS